VQFQVDSALSMIFDGERFGGTASTASLNIATSGGQHASIIGGTYDTAFAVSGATVNVLPRTGHVLLGTATDNTTGDKNARVQLDESTSCGVYLGNTNNTGKAVLDWYEEGTWTPVLSFGGASVDITYGTQEGRYVRIGSWVHAQCSIILTSKGSSTGVASIAGLTFTVFSGFSGRGGGGAAGYWANFAAGLTSTIICRSDQAATTVSVWKTGGAGVPTQLQDTDFANNSQLNFHVSYKVSGT
jgi:hypothetical protein